MQCVKCGGNVSCHLVCVDNCDALCATYLKPMSAAEISSQIQDWSMGGGLFLDYCNLLLSYTAFNKVSLFVSATDCLVYSSLGSNVL